MTTTTATTSTSMPVSVPVSTDTPRSTRTLPAEVRGRLMDAAQHVSFPQGLRLLHEGGRADRFWIVRSGAIALDVHVPGRRPAVLDTLGFGGLVGCSWLFAPYRWQFGAVTVSPVRAYEFDAAAVREMCRQDPGTGGAVGRWVGGVLAHRMAVARTRLLDLYAPYGSGVAG